MKFEETYLNDNILDALDYMHFKEMTPIQEKCIPQLLDGHDLLGVAQTGTGKTAAYLLPILSMIDDGSVTFPDGRKVEFPRDANNCIIMAPTRELAQQIDQAMQGFSYYLNGVSSIAIYGGNDGNRYEQEHKGLTLGADVVIATPGRLISHITMGNADFSKASFFILDEADRMLDMGFSEDIIKISKQLPKTCQTIMFSATMPDKIEELAKTLLKKPVVVKIAVSKPAEKIKQSAYLCYEPQKIKLIKHLFQTGNLKRVIIFGGKKQKVKAINKQLIQLGIKSGEMHSDLEQAQRDEMMYQFKSGQIDVLVATDIVSRGIDIDDIAMVINYDVPQDPEDYVHRIGRTARAEKDGVAITFITEDDFYYFNQIERLLEKEVTKTPLPEGIGDGPEYRVMKSQGQRRRNKTGNSKNKDKNSRQKENKTDKKEVQAADKKEVQAADNKKQRSKKPHHNKEKESRQNTTENASPDKQRHAQQATNDTPDKVRTGKRKKYKKTKTNDQRHSAKQKESTIQTTKSSIEKKDNPSGVKEIISKPLKWLKKIIS